MRISKSSSKERLPALQQAAPHIPRQTHSQTLPRPPMNLQKNAAFVFVPKAPQILQKRHIFISTLDCEKPRASVQLYESDEPQQQLEVVFLNTYHNHVDFQWNRMSSRLL